MATVKPIPDGYPQITPYLHVDDAASAIAFYIKVFGGKERMRLDGPDGKVGHAEVEIGTSLIMLADEFPDMGVLSPTTIGGTPVVLSIYVDDVDETVGQALLAGATELRAIENKFYGDRSGQVLDPFGHIWNISTHIEDVSPEEMGRRAAAFTGEG